MAVSNGAAESAICWDMDAKGASFRFLVVDEEAVVRGRLLCNGEQPRIQDFARNVQAVGVSDTECGRIWLIECAGVRYLVVLFTGEGQKERQLSWWVVALIAAFV